MLIQIDEHVGLVRFLHSKTRLRGAVELIGKGCEEGSNWGGERLVQNVKLISNPSWLPGNAPPK